MAKKHVDEYFNKISLQYIDMINELKDMEKEASNGLIDPDRLDEMKKSIEPLKANFMRISYIMYLLNLPNRREKQKKYEREKKKVLDNLKGHTLDDLMDENKKIIQHSKEIIN